MRTIPISPEARACGAVVRRLRLQRGWSMEDLGRAAGYSTQHVSALERGRINAPLGTWIQMARALRVPLCRIVVAVDGPLWQQLLEA